MKAIRRLVGQPCVQEDDLEACIWQDITARARETLRAVLLPSTGRRAPPFTIAVSGRRPRVTS